MTSVRRVVTGCSLLPVLALATAGCARGSSAKAGDSAGAAGDSVGLLADSATPRAAPDTAPSGAAPAPDSTPREAVPRPAGAAAGQPSPTPRVTPSETVMTGKVVTGGLAAEPVTTLQVEGARPTRLIGPLEPELRRLGGATVWVAGEPGGGAPNGSFTVSRYDIVMIDGAKPAVGTLAARDGGFWLAGTDIVKLAAVPAALQSRAGAKVWIVGRRSGSELVVQTYGIIREP